MAIQQTAEKEKFRQDFDSLLANLGIEPTNADGHLHALMVLTAYNEFRNALPADADVEIETGLWFARERAKLRTPPPMPTDGHFSLIEM
jgi:hypothetical protein